MLVERDGQRDVVKILDFGIAKVTQPQSGRRGAHAGGRHLRHARVPVARAGAGRGRRRARRHLRRRRHPLRDARGPPPVRDRGQGQDHLDAPRARAAAHPRRQPDRRRAAAAGAGGDAGDGEVARTPVRDRDRVPAGAGGCRGADRDRAPRSRSRRWPRRTRAPGRCCAGSWARAPAGWRPRWSAWRWYRRHRGRQAPRRARGRARRRAAQAGARAARHGGPATRGSRAGWRTATSRPRGARWNRRCRSGPRTAASVTCWVGWPTPTTSTRRRWCTTGRPSRSTQASGAIRCCCPISTRCWASPGRPTAALDLVIEKIGAPAADLLEKAANEGTDLERRQRAAAALDDIGEGKRVDQVSLSILELKKAGSCEEKKVVVVKLKGLGDVRALPALRAPGRPPPGPAALRRRRHPLHEEGAGCGDWRPRRQRREGRPAPPARKIRRGRGR